MTIVTGDGHSFFIVQAACSVGRIANIQHLAHVRQHEPRLTLSRHNPDRRAVEREGHHRGLRIRRHQVGGARFGLIITANDIGAGWNRLL
jgi:hypothetical protein